MEQRVEPLSGVDAEDVAAKRKWVREHYTPETEHKYETLDGKLRLLDTILKNNWIEKTETVKLQSLGIAFGDALVQEMGLKWIAIEDDYGRDPALILEGTSIKVFPLTSISKRIEQGEKVEIYELFKAACNTIARMKSESADLK
jgi:NAD-dependent SIR2 family protein deacetylase